MVCYLSPGIVVVYIVPGTIIKCLSTRHTSIHCARLDFPFSYVSFTIFLTNRREF